jgi:transcriptional regulator with XRE-family HTH domain
MAQPAAPLTFRSAHDRLLAQLRTRLRNGELTERALARRLGVSQSHINNVLRGRRNLSHELADSILKFLHYSLLDLHHDLEVQSHLSERVPAGALVEIEVLKYRIGPGQTWSTLRDGGSRYRAPCAMSGVSQCAVLGRLAPDHRMAGILFGCDMVLMDTSISARLADSPLSVFVVQRGPEALLRWVRGGFRSLYLADEGTLNCPVGWDRLPIREDQRLEVVKGRALWIGSEVALQGY